MSTSAGNGSPGSLMAEARAGSPDALSALYLEHGAALFRLAYRLVRAREDAEDVVHDVFVGLPEALRRYEERGSLVGWLKRVTARVALMRLRSGKRRREVALDGAAGRPGCGWCYRRTVRQCHLAPCCSLQQPWLRWSSS